MKYRVFDTSINKLFGAYDTEEEAMTLVRALVGTNDVGYAEDLAVSCEFADGHFSEPLSGAALLARAEEVAAQRELAGTPRSRVFGSRTGLSEGGESASLPIVASGRGWKMKATGGVKNALRESRVGRALHAPGRNRRRGG